ncbi:hypothetical protein T484DRAFT_1791807 [Baffinella frigidus]|nr:hypothetical protein T484DRAFT_1791807 [Cryptophyta sp. CCMP2293]
MRGMRGAACHLFFVAAALAATSSPHSKSPSWTWGGSAGEPVRPGSVPSGSRGLGSAAHLRLRGGGDDYASMRATFLSGAAGGSPRKPPPSKPAAAAPVASASATGGWGGGKGAGQEKGKGGCKIVLSLSSTSSFVATSSFPPAGVKEAYSRAGGRYDGEKKRWTFPLEKYERVLTDLNALRRGGAAIKLDVRNR